MPSFAAMLDVLRSIASVAAIGLCAFGIGRPLLRLLRLNQGDALAIGTWSLSLGLLAASGLLTALGWLGWLYEPALAAISLAGSLWSLVELICIWLGRSGPRFVETESELPSPSGSPRALPYALALAGVVLLGSAIAALAPPTSAEVLNGTFDRPKTALVEHSFWPLWRDGQAAPTIVQTWYLWALALDGPVAANLLQWSLGGLLALATVLVARTLTGSRASLLAGCLVLFSPGIQGQMCLPREDLALALLTTLSLAASLEVLLRLESSAWALVAGLTLGAAIATSPAGVPFALATAALWAWACGAHRESRPEMLRAGRLVALGMVAMAAPWFILARFAPADRLTTASELESLGSAVRQLGPLLLLALSGLVFARRLRGLHLVLVILATYPLFVLVGHCTAHWWSPMVPLASVVGVWVWQELDRLPRWAYRASIAAVTVLALLTPVACWQMAAGTAAVACGWQSRGDFLLEREPSYRAASLLNRIAKPSDTLFCQGARTFYFSCPARRTDAASGAMPWPIADDTENELLARARGAGCSYLLLASPFEPAVTPEAASSPTDPGPPAAASASSESERCGEVIPILEYRCADDNNRLIRYRLLRIR